MSRWGEKTSQFAIDTINTNVCFRKIDSMLLGSPSEPNTNCLPLAWGGGGGGGGFFGGVAGGGGGVVGGREGGRKGST